MKIASKLFLSAALCISSFPLMAMDPQEGDKGNAVPHLAPSRGAPQNLDRGLRWKSVLK